MYENIEKLICAGYSIIIEECRYGPGFYLALDKSTFLFGQRPIAALIDKATDGDIVAVEAMDSLDDLSSEFASFLFTKSDTIQDGLMHLEEKASLWNAQDKAAQDKILQKIQSSAAQQMLSRGSQTPHPQKEF